MPRKKKWFPPDWENHCTSGGYTGNYPALKDWPGPVVRVHPHDGGLKRIVHATIRSWIGFSPGAKHYYVEIHEETNAVWYGIGDIGSPKGHWVHLSKEQDPEGQGRRFYAEFTDEDEARKYRDNILRRYFPTKTHFRIGEHGEVFKGQQWTYKEGD